METQPRSTHHRAPGTLRVGGSVNTSPARSVSDMNTTRSTKQPATQLRAARTGLALAGTALVLAGTSAQTAGADSPATSRSAVGDVVTCLIGGSPVALTGTSGTVRSAETTRIDGQGRAHSMFRVAAHQIHLVGPDRSTYRLTGSGFDHVLYPTEQNYGDVLSERIDYHFDVTGDSGVVGVVRFTLSFEAGSAPVIADSSTCQVPQG